MITPVRLSIALRAYAVPATPADRTWDDRTGWRTPQFGARALVFDTETTVDAYQNLLVGSFVVLEEPDPVRHQGGHRVASHDPPRPFRSLIIGDGLTRKERDVVHGFANDHPIQIIRHGYARLEPMPVLSRDEFVDDVFYPEVHDLGSLCVGYHLGFDLTRLAIRCTIGRRYNRDAFRIELCQHSDHPPVYLQVLSNKQSFIKFGGVPPPQGRKRRPGRVTFRGRFLDLRQAVYALTGDSGGLESDCTKFGIKTAKLAAQLGTVTSELIAYNIHDTEALTAGLFTAVWQSYHEYTDIATTDSEFYRQAKRRITEIYSPATIGKSHQDALGIVTPRFAIVLPGNSPQG
jgi:hypothetical protein